MSRLSIVAWIDVALVVLIGLAFGWNVAAGFAFGFALALGMLWLRYR